MSTYVTVAGVECEPGCWVDGHWGQYGPDHLADKVEIEFPELAHRFAADQYSDPRWLRQEADRITEDIGFTPEPICANCDLATHVDYRRDRDRWVHVTQYRTIGVRLETDVRDGCRLPQPAWPASRVWEQRVDATDEIEEWLNEHTPDGYVWHWRDGEFYLSPLCEDGECDDDTCAHWD